jgi:hypothetical protein
MNRVLDILGQTPGGEDIKVVGVPANRIRVDRREIPPTNDEFIELIKAEETAIILGQCVSVVPASTWFPWKPGDQEIHRTIYAPHLTTGAELGTVPSELLVDFSELTTNTVVKMYRKFGSKVKPAIAQLIGFDGGNLGPQSNELIHDHVFIATEPEGKDIIGTGLTSSQRLKYYGPLNQFVERQFDLAVGELVADLGIGAKLEAMRHPRNKTQPMLRIRLTKSTELEDYLGAIYKIGDRLNLAYLSVWKALERVYLSPDQNHHQIRKECMAELTGLGLAPNLANKMLKVGKTLFKPNIEMLNGWLEKQSESPLTAEVLAKIEKRKRSLEHVKKMADNFSEGKIDHLALSQLLVVDQAGGVEDQKRLSLLPAYGCPFRIYTNDYDVTSDGKLIVHSFNIMPQFGTDGNTGESEVGAMFKRIT